MELFSLEKERNSDTCHNMDESWKRHVKWNKPATKDQLLCDFTYNDVSRTGKFIETESRAEGTRVGAEENRESVLNGSRVSTWDDGNIPARGGGSPALWIRLKPLNCAHHMAKMVMFYVIFTTIKSMLKFAKFSEHRMNSCALIPPGLRRNTMTWKMAADTHYHYCTTRSCYVHPLHY